MRLVRAGRNDDVLPKLAVAEGDGCGGNSPPLPPPPLMPPRVLLGDDRDSGGRNDGVLLEGVVVEAASITAGLRGGIEGEEGVVDTFCDEARVSHGDD